MRKVLVALLAGAALTGISNGQGTTSAPARAPVAAPNPADVVPLEVFSHFPDLDNPVISPNGRAIATKIRFQGGQALAIVPIGEGGKPDVIAKDGQFDQQDQSVMRSWRWADDDNLLITLTSRQNFMGQTFDASRLIGYNRTTKKVTRLGWEGSKFSFGRVLWVSHEGPPTILLERTPDNGDTEKLNQPEVIRIDVLTGATQIVQRQSPSIDRWYADGAGVIRLGLGSDRSTGKSVAMYRSGPGANFRTVFSGREDRFDPMPLPTIFLKEPDKGIAISRKDGYGAVYEVDLNSLQLGRRLFGLAGYDVAGVGAGPDRNTLDTIYTVQHRSRNVYLNPRLKEIQQALDETFGEGNAAIESADLRRERLIVSVAKPGMPGGYYLYDTNTGGVGLLGWVNGAIKDRVLNPVSSVRYRASDGREIEAVLTLPRHRLGQKNLPLIILPHGGPWARDSEDWEYVPWAQPLAELGYVVIQPNYRGSSGYGKDWEKASDGNWGERMQDDLNDAVAYLAAQGTIDPRRVCMMGWSYGGYAASRAAQRDGSKYRCAISGAGVHDLPAMVTYDKDYLGEYGAKTGLGAAGKLEAVSPGLHPKDYSTPILIIHGEHDQRVPVSQSRNLVSRLRSAGKVEGRDFEYVEIPRETHNLLLESSRLKVLEAVKAFLDKHNPA